MCLRFTVADTSTSPSTKTPTDVIVQHNPPIVINPQIPSVDSTSNTQANPTGNSRPQHIAGENSNFYQQFLLGISTAAATGGLSLAADGHVSEKRRSMRAHGFFISDTVSPYSSSMPLTYKQMVNFHVDLPITALFQQVHQQARLHHYDILARAPAFKDMSAPLFYAWLGFSIGVAPSHYARSRRRDILG